MLGVTVTAQVSFLPPSAVVAVMVAVPAATPLTLPFSSTVATDVSLLLHVTFLLVASEGATLAVSVVVFFASIETVLGDTVTPVTATGSSASSMVTVSALSLERTVNRFALSSYPRYLGLSGVEAVALVLFR